MSDVEDVKRSDDDRPVSIKDLENKELFSIINKKLGIDDISQVSKSNICRMLLGMAQQIDALQSAALRLQFELFCENEKHLLLEKLPVAISEQFAKEKAARLARLASQRTGILDSVGRMIMRRGG